SVKDDVSSIGRGDVDRSAGNSRRSRAAVPDLGETVGRGRRNGTGASALEGDPARTRRDGDGAVLATRRRRSATSVADQRVMVGFGPVPSKQGYPGVGRAAGYRDVSTQNISASGGAVSTVTDLQERLRSVTDRSIHEHTAH